MNGTEAEIEADVDEPNRTESQVSPNADIEDDLKSELEIEEQFGTSGVIRQSVPVLALAPALFLPLLLLPATSLILLLELILMVGLVLPPVLFQAALVLVHPIPVGSVPLSKACVVGFPLPLKLISMALFVLMHVFGHLSSAGL